MPEVVTVTSQEARIILLSDVEKLGHYNEQVARFLHPGEWKKRFNPELINHWDALLSDSNKEQRLNRLISDGLTRIASGRDPRLIEVLNLRFGIKDGTLKTHEEIGAFMPRHRLRAITTLTTLTKESSIGIGSGMVCTMERMAFHRLRRFFYGKIEEFLPDITEPEQPSNRPLTKAHLRLI